MALVAFQRSLYMIGPLAGRNHIVMTAGTHTQHFIMINRTGLHWRPRGRSRLVTRIARIRGTNMISTLARCDCSIVATDTRTYDMRMINVRICNGSPWSRSRLVTRITGICAIDMIGALT